MKAFCPRKGHCFYALILNRPNGLFVVRIQIFAKVEGARKYSCLRVRSLCARRWYSRNAGGAHAWAPLWYKYGLLDAKIRGRICRGSAHTCEFSGVDFSSIYFEKRRFVGFFVLVSCSRNNTSFESSKEAVNRFRSLFQSRSPQNSFGRRSLLDTLYSIQYHVCLIFLDTFKWIHQKSLFRSWVLCKKKKKSNKA